jgi:hypothetical protein
MNAGKTISAGTKIDSDLNKRLIAGAKSAHLGKSDFIRQAIEEKLIAYDGATAKLNQLQDAIDGNNTAIEERLIEIKAAILSISQVIEGIEERIK